MAKTVVNECSWGTVQFSRMSEAQCEKLHWASLEILERVGVRLFLREAVELLRKAGADVSEGSLVRIPAGLVERALTTSPQRVVLCDRHGRPAMPLEGDRSYYGPGSDTLHIVDHRTGVRRDPLLRDVQEGVRLCDALPNIDFVMSLMLPTDVDPTLADRHQMEVMLSHSTKPIVVVTYELSGLLDAVRMAEAVVGGPDALRRAPLMACYINVATGLRHNQEALEKLMFLAAKGLPFTYVPVSTSGVSSPVTPAGSLAVDNAGMLAGLVLSQLVREGAPFIAPGMQHSPLDLRTLVGAYCEPERGYAQAMGRFYRLPRFALGGVTEAKLPDQQAAAEAALTLLTETLGGGNIIHDLGYLESGLGFSLVQLVICDEIVDWIEAYSRTIEISDETLALDLVAQYRDEGPWLDSDHTRRHYRERWYPHLFERGNYETWQAKGRQTLAERASDRVERLLAEHRPEPLPADVQARLRAIVQGAGVV